MAEKFALGDVTTVYVKKALERGGYGSEDIISAKFVLMTESGKEQHQITYPDPDSATADKTDTGYVYVWEQDGKTVGDF